MNVSERRTVYNIEMNHAHSTKPKYAHLKNQITVEGLTILTQTCNHRLQIRVFTKNGSSWESTIFNMDRGVYQLEKTVLESISYLLGNLQVQKLLIQKCQDFRGS